MKKMMGFMLICVLMALLQSACALDAAVVYHSESQEGAVLYSGAGTDRIGSLFNGVILEQIATQGAWSLVRKSDGLLSVEGYIQSDFLDFSAESVWAPHPIKVGEIHCNSQSGVPYTELPEPNAMVLGRLPNKGRVVVLGLLNDYCLVSYANRYVFISPEYVDLGADAVAPDMFGGVPETGYLFLDISADTHPALKVFPDDVSESIDHPWLDNVQALMTDRPVELIADLGEWYQVRLMDEYGAGFMRKDCFREEILLGDLLVSEPLVLNSGIYRAGLDLMPGLYTFASGEKGGGIIHVISDDTTHGRSIKASEGSTYTFYIPDGATVTLEADGCLTPMALQPIFAQDTGFIYKGYGLFFPKYQFPLILYGQTGVSYQFSVADKTQTGIVTIYNLLGEMQNQILLGADEQYEANINEIFDSSFAQIENCILQIQYSHNG